VKSKNSEAPQYVTFSIPLLLCLFIHADILLCTWFSNTSNVCYCVYDVSIFEQLVAYLVIFMDHKTFSYNALRKEENSPKLENKELHVVNVNPCVLYCVITGRAVYLLRRAVDRE
jgi:hypothetical protein